MSRFAAVALVECDVTGLMHLESAALIGHLSYNSTHAFVAVDKVVVDVAVGARAAAAAASASSVAAYTAAVAANTVVVDTVLVSTAVGKDTTSLAVKGGSLLKLALHPSNQDCWRHL